MVKNSIFTDIISRLDYLSSIPKTVLDLAITAEDLILLGVKKQNLNLTFDGILFAIFSGKLQNTKESIIKFITEKK